MLQTFPTATELAPINALRSFCIGHMERHMFSHPPSSCSCEYNTSLIKKETKGKLYINIRHLNFQFCNHGRKEKSDDLPIVEL